MYISERSAISTPNYFPLSTDGFHFSNIALKQFWALKPLQNSHCYFVTNSQSL